MRIINGKWQDQHGEAVTVFNYNEVKEIGDNLVNLYGKNITYSKIELVSAIKSLTPEQEDSLAYILSQDGLMAKLAGY
jgi:hypothetical protein